MRTALISAALVGITVFAPAGVAVAAPVSTSPHSPVAGPSHYRTTMIAGPCYRDPLGILCLLGTGSTWLRE